jgi:hypothetical protein
MVAALKAKPKYAKTIIQTVLAFVPSQAVAEVIAAAMQAFPERTSSDF